MRMEFDVQRSHRVSHTHRHTLTTHFPGSCLCSCCGLSNLQIVHHNYRLVYWSPMANSIVYSLLCGFVLEGFRHKSDEMSLEETRKGKILSTSISMCVYVACAQESDNCKLKMQLKEMLVAHTNKVKEEHTYTHYTHTIPGRETPTQVREAHVCTQIATSMTINTTCYHISQLDRKQAV